MRIDFDTIVGAAILLLLAVCIDALFSAQEAKRKCEERGGVMVHSACLKREVLQP